VGLYQHVTTEEHIFERPFQINLHTRSYSLLLVWLHQGPYNVTVMQHRQNNKHREDNSAGNTTMGFCISKATDRQSTSEVVTHSMSQQPVKQSSTASQATVNSQSSSQ
jgi:hypothetical protein